MGSGIKLTYDYVKDRIESVDGYKLLSTEYKNAFTKLEIMCPEGHKFGMKYNDFQQGHRCKLCYHLKTGNRCKLQYDDIKKYIEIEGYKLLSDAYKGNKKKLHIKCNKGHMFYMSYNSFSSGQRCPRCNGGSRIPYDEIKEKIESFGYKLLNDNYKNNKEKLKISCPEGHMLKMSYSHFQQGNRCFVCSRKKIAEKRKLPYKEIKEKIEVENYSLVSKEYKNTFTKLEIMCPNKHMFEMTFANFFHHKQRCPICQKDRFISKAEKEIAEYIKSVYKGIVVENDRTQIINPQTGKYLELDIWLPEINKAIEYNGEYWHSNERKKELDLVKKLHCEKTNIELLTIMDSEWQKNKNFNKIEEFIFRL